MALPFLWPYDFEKEGVMNQAKLAVLIFTARFVDADGLSKVSEPNLIKADK
jgi:hypothetical protein